MIKNVLELEEWMTEYVVFMAICPPAQMTNGTVASFKSLQNATP